jgi:hypothetical protein
MPDISGGRHPQKSDKIGDRNPQMSNKIGDRHPQMPDVFEKAPSSIFMPF